MDSNFRYAKKIGLVGEIINYFGINTYYPSSITELVDNRASIKPTSITKPLGLLFNETSLVKIESCLYIPYDKNIALLTDTRSYLEINISEFNGMLPIEREHIINILLKLKKEEEKPYLVKYRTKNKL